MAVNPSLVPGRIPQSLAQKFISTAGQNGVHGSMFMSSLGTAAQSCRGANGRHASAPTNGTAGRDINIHLNHDARKPKSVQVVAEAQGQFELSSADRLLLDAHGGTGGNGGWGESGQNGGWGYNGRDATRYSDGTNGGPGGDGGDGGYGTSGANGGMGGNVRTTVPEGDLDLLLAVTADVHGGGGGAAGRHGAPGNGGPGGRGGASYSWTESHTTYYTDSNGNQQSNTTYTHHTNPGGHNGPDGRSGRPPNVMLNSGRDGQSGRTKIDVVMNNGTSKSFVSRYHLVVDSFEVVDENDDGINEPGEYLIVKNIIVRNIGPMPSPSGQLLKIVIRDSPWLKPDTTAPLSFPDSIKPNQQARISGQLRAFIRHETVPREQGVVFKGTDTVSLLGYSERLHRSIPEFSGGVPIVVQYPLQLTVPAYMDCMTKSDEMMVSWMVNNISNKPYGSTTDMRRTTRTRLIDTLEFFVLQNAVDEKNYMEDLIDQLPAAKGAPLGETFTVAYETKAFSTGTFVLELHLSDPHTGEMRRIMHHDVNIQISEGYEFSEESQFLLVVNASTNNDAITQMQKFIRAELFLSVDIFNVSLTGTLIDDETKKSVLLNYNGKSIIVSGNPFTYFSRDIRYNWDLIDPQDALKLLMNQTSFMFCGVLSKIDQDNLANWSARMRYPADLGTDKDDSLVEHKNRDILLKSLGAEPSPDTYTLGLKNQYKLSNSFRIFRSKIDKRLQNKGDKLSGKLGKHLPMRRFIVTSEKQIGEVIEDEPLEKLASEIKDEPLEVIDEKEEEEQPPKKKKKPKKEKVKTKKVKKVKLPPPTGVISTAEGLPRTANCKVSSVAIVDSNGSITSHQVVMMIASIPFHKLVVILWNIIRSVRSSGISSELMYRSLPGFHTHLELNVNHNYDQEGNENGGSRLISYQVCMAVVWAVEYALDCDIQQLCDKNHMVDAVNSQSILLHAPRLRQFVVEIPKDDSITASDEGISLAIQVLSFLNVALCSPSIISGALRSIPGLTNRRVKLRRTVSKYHSVALSFLVPPTMVKSIKKRIKDESKLLRKELKADKGAPRIHQNIVRRRMSKLTGSPLGFHDVAAEAVGSIFLNPQEWDNHVTAYRLFRNRLQDDARHAKEVREEMIANVYTNSDYVSLTSFN